MAADPVERSESSSRREFLKASALAAASAGPLANGAGAAAADTPPAGTPAAAPGKEGAAGNRDSKDPYALAERFSHFLRVTDVTDGLDAVGRADLTQLGAAIRPLWMGMRFWGPAVTMRVIPTNRRMPVIDRKDALRQHAIWREMGGRTIIPGRVELIDVEVPVGCGGVMVRPGDIVGCDWDGCLVVPLEVAEDVLAISARIAVDDKKSRRKLYDRVGRNPDETVDWEAAAEYFKDLL